MLVATLAAFAVPFELFLFAYAVLGPLHYLTEISWLHKRQYFGSSKYDYIPLIAIGVVLLLFVFVFKEQSMFINVLIFVAFFYALGMVLIKDTLAKIAFIAVGVVAGAIMQQAQPFILLFGVFLPTLIHVFVFTGLFILYGALKSKSTTGLLSIGVFVLCALSFFVYKPVFPFYQVTEYAQNALVQSGFIQLNKNLIELFKLGEFTRETVFESGIGLSIMRFIAFAYTYHYLNWFSKTNVIKWHDVPRPWLLAVVVMWVASVGLYAYDYRTGLLALYFLSMLHVFLEFPLNYRSMIGIGDELGLLLKGKPQTAAKRK